MIRINLLGVPKPKKGKHATVALSPASGEGPSLVLVAIVVLLITAAANGFYYMKLTREAAKLQKDMATANSEYARLTQVKIRYQELERQREAYKQRVDVIDQLRAKQSGPVDLLTTVGNTVNHTDEVWLSSMADRGNAISLQGTALSIYSVADLMRNLEKTGYFKTVEIKSAYQDEAVKDMQAFVFELNCEKRSAAPAAAVQPVAKKS